MLLIRKEQISNREKTKRVKGRKEKVKGRKKEILFLQFLYSNCIIVSISNFIIICSALLSLKHA
jgi:hypothetical protein